ncbi:hypothetical protein RirG_010150 [Rhizophagus irregularis DAOM 197198w]|uniref:Uncharacterized protein n=1 Tax=Rhizophagus irregularis (strain DAOM 197198w) TaxID=1432141 RepID=A0A015M1T7_RHIIW|nr:hypothetical protein RirG_010150 [Rhizophagus irregularis DAOM 197198w]
MDQTGNSSAPQNNNENNQHTLINNVVESVVELEIVNYNYAATDNQECEID